MRFGKLMNGDNLLQVRSTITGNVDTQHESNTESPVDTLPVTEAVTTWRARVSLAKGDLC